MNADNPNYGVIDKQQHGCCIPGSCVNDDAKKLVSVSLCYKIFFDYYTLTKNDSYYDSPNLDNIYCQLQQREFDIGFWIVLSIFLFFAIMVVITTCYRHCYNR